VIGGKNFIDPSGESNTPTSAWKNEKTGVQKTEFAGKGWRNEKCLRGVNSTGSGRRQDMKGSAEGRKEIGGTRGV